MGNLHILDANAINIFADASIKKIDKVTYCCPGCIVVLNSADGPIIETVDKRVMTGTNNSSEVTAILMAVQQAVRFNYFPNVINVFSDSKISVFGLREWFFTWINNIKNGVMLSSTGKEVANQQIFLHVVNFILNNQLNINLLHQMGHVNSAADKIEAKNVFLRSNNEFLSDEELEYISFYNNTIDSLTRDYLNQIPMPEVIGSNNPINYMVDRGSMDLYKYLVTGKAYDGVVYGQF